MPKLAAAILFIALAAGAGVAAACMDPRQESAQSDPRFTRHETPNHRHLLRYQELLHAD